MIEVEALTKVYREVAAVTDLTFEVVAGEVLGLVGPNGAGKTTTLRSVAGIIRPTGGRIRIAGFDIESEPLHARARLAFIPDEPQLFDYLTVEEHFRFTAMLYEVADASQKIERMLAQMELVEKRRALPEELSRGMKQKLAIGCGLLHDPGALLLDEPLTGLDPGAIRRMKQTILERARAGAAVILSSHLLHLVEELCDRILLIHGGRAVAVGPIRDIIASRPELEGRGLEDVFLALTEAGR